MSVPALAAPAIDHLHSWFQAPGRPASGALFQGDCLEVMGKLTASSFRVIVTSPPYNLRNSTGNGMHDGRGGKWQQAALLQGYDTHADPGLFFFLNSRNPYKNDLAIACSRIPKLPITASGESYICCDRILYKDTHFHSHTAKRICCLARDLCEELHDFVRRKKTVERQHKAQILEALTTIIAERRSSS